MLQLPLRAGTTPHPFLPNIVRICQLQMLTMDLPIASPWWPPKVHILDDWVWVQIFSPLHLLKFFLDYYLQSVIDQRVGVSKLLSATFCFLPSILVLWLRTSNKLRCCGKGSIIIRFCSWFCAMVISFHEGMLSMEHLKLMWNFSGQIW
jgi:hypothetical protein